MKKENTQQIIIINGIEELTGLKKDLSGFKEYLETFVHKTLQPVFLPAAKAAEHFCVTESTLSEYAERGEYKKYKFGDRKVFYQIKEIEDFILRSVENK